MKRTMLSLLLCLSLCLPVALAAETVSTDSYPSYQEAVEILREPSLYSIDTILDAEPCSVFLYHRVRVPHSTYRYLDLIYKDGSPLGGGTVVHLPLQVDNATWGTTVRPDVLELSEDGAHLVYGYHLPGGGAVSNLVDLATGTATQETRDGFSDVPDGSWFEEGVRTCAGKGVMVGVGESSFSPDTALTQAECLTLAYRLYDLRHGGGRAFLKAPDDWGQITLTIEGEEPISGFSDRFVCAPYQYGTSNANRPNMRLALPLAKEDESWAAAQSGKAAVLTAGGASVTGTVDHSYIPAQGTALFFLTERHNESPAEFAARTACQNVYPSPDKWYRDVVYTITERNLDQRFQPRDFSELTATREFFARALTISAGELEPLYAIDKLPDLDRAVEPDIFKLYDAGVLTGTDEYGTFDGDGTLTRAQAAVMAARVLDKSQRVSTPPMAGGAYAKAVAELRSGMGYSNEQTFETDLCTVFVYDLAGMMNAPAGVIRIVYKAGSEPGEGYVLEPPHVHVGMKLTPPDTMALDPEKMTFTYTYFYDTTAYDSSIQSYDTRTEPGTFTFTVDLTTGEVHREHRGIDYAGAMAHVTRKRAISSNEHSEDRVVEKTLESETCTAVLTRGRYLDKYDDYILSLVYKPGSALGDGTIKQLILPSTVLNEGYTYRPTDRAPDSMGFSEDGSKFIYTYRFSDRLALTCYGQDTGTVLHEAGTYVYTVDIATGELSVELVDSYQHAMSRLTGLRDFQKIETDTCTVVTGMDKVANYDRAFICLIYKEGSLLGSGATIWLPTHGGISVYDSTPPHTLSVSEDGRTLAYSYRFEDPVYSWDGRLAQKAGTFTYTVDLTTGEYDMAYQEPQKISSTVSRAGHFLWPIFQNISRLAIQGFADGLQRGEPHRSGLACL